MVVRMFIVLVVRMYISCWSSNQTDPCSKPRGSHLRSECSLQDNTRASTDRTAASKCLRGCACFHHHDLVGALFDETQQV